MVEDLPDGSYIRRRLREFIKPPVTITDPPAGIEFERDVPVPMRDGVTLRVNVFGPSGEGQYPVIMCAHPYGKDNLPKKTKSGYSPSFQYRAFRQPKPVKFSAWTGWEAPDPAFWVRQGYAVVNCDLRGFGHSEGVGELISDQEAQDYYELIEWAAHQPWSTGRIGLNGVSYLALSQYKVAALQPPHLAAICVWEGFSDMYRDFARPGGVLETGFSRMWATSVSMQGHVKGHFRGEMAERPLYDDWWQARVADLSAIEVPALICGSFSDHNLHSRGCFESFNRISSEHRWLYTHRGGKWATYYSQEALDFQARFFDHFLKDADNGMRDVPPVRLEVHDTQDDYTVRPETAWPPSNITWKPLYLQAATAKLHGDPVDYVTSTDFTTQRGSAATFSWDVTDDVELVGPMKLRVHVELQDTDDMDLFVGLRKFRDGRQVVFEGSYGFGWDMITNGSLKISHRELDDDLTQPGRPVHTHNKRQPIGPGEIVPVEIALLPSATNFRAGDVLRLDIQGRWFYPTNPLRGQFPARYRHSTKGRCIIHAGGPDFDSHLLIPVCNPAVITSGGASRGEAT